MEKGNPLSIDKHRFKVYGPASPWVILWRIVPIFAVNELLFGQRIPRLSLLDQSSSKPRFERQVYPCPHCGTHHDSRLWSFRKGTHLGNWFGFYCRECGGIIPGAWNYTSWLILALTSPLWFGFRKPLKQSWIRWQKKRLEGIDPEKVESPFSKQRWLWTGLLWGWATFVLVELIIGPLTGDAAISLKTFYIGIPIWTVTGLCFGLSMRWWEKRKS